jgi:hypothetical protein
MLRGRRISSPAKEAGAPTNGGADASQQRSLHKSVARNDPKKRATDKLFYCNGKSVFCDASESLGTDGALKSFMKKVGSADPLWDCTLFVLDDPEKDGHAMRVRAVDYDKSADTYTVKTTDTGLQGALKEGSKFLDVPELGKEQVWKLLGVEGRKRAKQKKDYVSTEDSDWEGKKHTHAEYFCCKLQ